MSLVVIFIVMKILSFKHVFFFVIFTNACWNEYSEKWLESHKPCWVIYSPKWRTWWLKAFSFSPTWQSFRFSHVKDYFHLPLVCWRLSDLTDRGVHLGHWVYCGPHVLYRFKRGFWVHNDFYIISLKSGQFEFGYKTGKYQIIEYVLNSSTYRTKKDFNTIGII